MTAAAKSPKKAKYATAGIFIYFYFWFELIQRF